LRVKNNIVLFYIIEMSLETNLMEIANTIFSKPPAPKCSIELQLEDTTVEMSSDLNKTISDILLFLTINGVEILFKTRDLTSLTQTQFTLLSEYINSYGYQVNVTANDTEFSPWGISEPLLKIDVSFSRIFH
jgi:hypothetical protein